MLCALGAGGAKNLFKFWGPIPDFCRFRGRMPVEIEMPAKNRNGMAPGANTGLHVRNAASTTRGHQGTCLAYPERIWPWPRSKSSVSASANTSAVGSRRHLRHDRALSSRRCPVRASPDLPRAHSRQTSCLRACISFVVVSRFMQAVCQRYR